MGFTSLVLALWDSHHWKTRFVIMPTWLSLVTGDTAGCHNENLWCPKWWPSWHYDNSWLLASYNVSMLSCPSYLYNQNLYNPYDGFCIEMDCVFVLFQVRRPTQSETTWLLADAIGQGDGRWSSVLTKWQQTSQLACPWSYTLLTTEKVF